MNNLNAFSKLKPICNNFLRNCTIKNIDELENAVKEVDSDAVESLQEYIVLPVLLHLKKNPSEKITMKCIDFLTLIFKKSKVKTWSFFVDIFISVLSKISYFQDPNELKSVSEELKLSICKNMLCLIQCSTEEILNKMYSLSFRPYLGQAFFTFNILLRNEKSKTLLKAVLCTIGGFVYNENYIGKSDKKTKLVASEALASCLPGLTLALYRVIVRDDKEAHSIIVMALGIFTNLIVLVVENESYERRIFNDTSSDIYKICYKVDKENLNIPVIIKNQDWFKSVSEKLEILVTNLTYQMNHYHWKVRFEFLELSKLLIFKCSKTLEKCIPVLLPSVFALSVDSNENVSSYAKSILVSLSEELQNVNYTNLNLVIEENIENLISQLIKCEFSENDDKKLSTLKVLLGYISVSGISLNKLLFSMTCLERIIMTLVALLEFDVLDFNLVEEISLTEITEINHMWPKKKFKFFQNEEILNTICKICVSCRHIGNSQLLINYLLEKMTSNDLYTLQCIFIIGNITKGLAEESDTSENHSTLISSILEMFLSPSLFDVPIHNDACVEKQRDESSVKMTLPNNVLNKNKLQICLLLEAIANCAHCIGVNFRLHLMNVLCQVMEKAGSSNFIISECGKICLHHIAQSCEYKSVEELIKGNADYITNIIMINFHEYLQKPEVAVVLRVAMEQSNADALVLFRNLIFQMLDFLDYNQDAAYHLLNVLFSVVMCIKKWFPSKKQNLVNSNSSVNVTNNIKSLIANYIALKKVQSENYAHFDDEEYEKSNVDFESRKHNGEFTQNANDNFSENEEKPNIPLHIDITCEIFKRCVHLQSSYNRFVRMLTLETVEICIFILSDYEKQLWPLIHEFWDPFLKRFTEETFVSKAFNVLLLIANECGNFVRSRTLKNVLPKLIHFLEKEYSNSLLKCNFKHYQWTSDHALQVLVLSEIGNLCTKLDIDSKDINIVAAACFPYLEEKQPKILQDAAVKSLNALVTVDPDSIWFYWNVLFCKENILIPPHDDLLKLSFPYSNCSLTSIKVDIEKLS